MILLLLIIALIIGCAISSFFGKRKDEKYYIFRTYQLYRENKVNLMTVIIAGFINLLIGSVIVGIIAFKYFISLL